MGESRVGQGLVSRSVPIPSDSQRKFDIWLSMMLWVYLFYINSVFSYSIYQHSLFTLVGGFIDLKYEQIFIFPIK